MLIDLERVEEDSEKEKNQPKFLGVEKVNPKSKEEKKGPRGLYSTLDMLEVRRNCIKERNKIH